LSLGRCIIDNAELVEGLLRLGADPNAGWEYDTALSRAIFKGSMDVINMLLSHGGNIHRGQLLHWALERSEPTEVVPLLLERGADPEQLEYDGLYPVWCALPYLDAPLHKAVRENKLDAASLLLKHGADPDKKNTEGKTARQLADELGNPAAVALFKGDSTALPTDGASAAPEAEA
jgi:ankyrin repeat protein